MKKIKYFKLFSNEKTIDLEEIVRKKLLDSDILEKEDNYDIAIAIGGDGTFLKMVSETYFDSNILYVGINAGTLGFAQEINIDEIDNFIKDTLKYVELRYRKNKGDTDAYFKRLSDCDLPY